MADKALVEPWELVTQSRAKLKNCTFGTRDELWDSCAPLEPVEMLVYMTT